jgi:hypothetical protein
MPRIRRHPFGGWRPHQTPLASGARGSAVMQHLRAMWRSIFEVLFVRAVALTKIPTATCTQQHRANRFTLALPNARAYFWGAGLVRTWFRACFAASLNNTSLAGSTFPASTCFLTTSKIACSKVSTCLRRHIESALLAMAALNSLLPPLPLTPYLLCHPGFAGCSREPSHKLS